MVRLYMRASLLKKVYRVQTRRAKRAYTKYQKVACLDKLFNKKTELHDMLRQPKCTQPTQPAWNAYHNRHFRPPAAKVCNREVWGWAVAYQLETWRCRLDVTPPPEVLLQQGAQIGSLLLSLLIPLVATPCLPWWLSK